MTNTISSNEPELEPLDRVRLARMALRIFFDDPSEAAPVWLFEIAEALDHQLGLGARERSDAAHAAAEHYLEAKAEGATISISDVAQQFGVGERTVYRRIQKLRPGSENGNRLP